MILRLKEFQKLQRSKVYATLLVSFLAMLLIPLMGSVLGFIGMFIAAMALYDLILWFWLMFTTVGCVIGEIMSRNIVRRKRLRCRIHATCCRCNTCSKVFLHEEELVV